MVLALQELCIAVTFPNEAKKVERFRKRNNKGVSTKYIFPHKRQDDDSSSSSNDGETLLKNA